MSSRLNGTLVINTCIAQTPALHGVMLMYNCYLSHFKEHRRITFYPSGFDLLLYPYTCFE